MYEMPLNLHKLAHWIAAHGFAFNVDTAHECIQIVIPCTRNGAASLPIIETVSNLNQARTALGY